MEMGDISDEYLTSTIKVDEEDHQQGWIAIQESPAKTDHQNFVQPGRCKRFKCIPLEPGFRAAEKITTKCKLTNCVWSTKCHDRGGTLTRLKKHARKNHQDKNVEICDICFKMFVDTDSILSHKCNSNGKNIFECRFCAYFSFSEFDFMDHFRSEHNIYDSIQYHHQINIMEMVGAGEIEKKLKCHLCTCNFSSFPVLNVHMSIFHLVSSDINMDFVHFHGPLIRKLVCNECCAHFTSSGTLVQHYMLVHKIMVPTLKISLQKSVKYSCNLCTIDKVYDFKMLEVHFLEKHDKILDVNDFDLSNWCTIAVTEFSKEEGKLRFSCDQCSDFYSTSDELKKHKVVKHGEYVCGKCNFSVDTKMALKIHTDEVHTGQCKFCDFTCTSFRGLHKHIPSKHLQIIDMSDLQSIYKDVKCDVVYHKCSLCLKNLSSSQNMKMHYYWFHNRVVCDFCKLSFHNSNSEIEHFVSNHLIECVHCNEKFTGLKELEMHLKVQHLNEKCYSVCGICGDSVNSRDELMQHRLKHKNASKTNNKYLCSQCGLQFVVKSSLEQHIENVHSKTDHNFCKMCNRKYKNLMLHLINTHGAVPKDRKCGRKFKCNICEKVYYNFGGLKKHMISHSKYKCTQCSMQFILMVNLEQHVLELHTNRYAYSCTVCTKIFSTESDFSLHVEFHQRSDTRADLLPVLRCELCDKFSLNRDAMENHVKCRHIMSGKLVNVKRKKPSGRPRYIKRTEK